ncbi:MAG: hypothetical protein LBR91_03010, partial [Puniceicoccales bacterium]|nr:hypothetical protein [Puniceicoccales bacterium]
MNTNTHKKVLLKFKILVLLACCMICSQRLGGAPLSVSISEKKTITQEWGIGKDEKNKESNSVEFTSAGSIAVESGAGATAANISFDEILSSEGADWPITLTFKNDPSVATEVVEDPKSTSYIHAHIYAKSTTNTIPAIGLDLFGGVNLNIKGGPIEDSKYYYIPTIVAYSNNLSDLGSSATTIHADTENVITKVDVYNECKLSAESKTAYHSTAGVLGKVEAYAYSALTLGLSNIEVGIDAAATGNNWTATATATMSNSAAGVLGAILGCGNGISTIDIDVGAITATISGSNNIWTAESNANAYHSAAGVLGTVLGSVEGENSTITVGGTVNGAITATISGDYNIWKATSTATANNSAAGIVGAALGCATSTSTIDVDVGNILVDIDAAATGNNWTAT